MPDRDGSLMAWAGALRNACQDSEMMRQIDRERIRQTERAINPPMLSTDHIRDGLEPQEFNGIASRYGRPTVPSDWRAELRVADIDVPMPNDARVADTGRKLCELCQIEGLRSCCEKCNGKYKSGMWHTGTTSSQPTEIYPVTESYVRALQRSNEMLMGVDWANDNDAQRISALEAQNQQMMNGLTPHNVNWFVTP